MMDQNHHRDQQRDYNNSKWEQIERERERDREYGRRNEVDNYYYNNKRYEPSGMGSSNNLRNS